MAAAKIGVGRLLLSVDEERNQLNKQMFKHLKELQAESCFSG